MNTFGSHHGRRFKNWRKPRKDPADDALLDLHFQALDTSLHERRRDDRMQDPGYRAAYEAAQPKQPTIEQGRDWVTYKYSQREFKDRLGIGDPHDVLTVEIDIFCRKVTVRMMHK